MADMPEALQRAIDHADDDEAVLADSVLEVLACDAAAVWGSLQSVLVDAGVPSSAHRRLDPSVSATVRLHMADGPGGLADAFPSITYEDLLTIAILAAAEALHRGG